MHDTQHPPGDVVIDGGGIDEQLTQARLDSAEGQLMVSFNELLTDAHRHLYAGELGMLADTVDSMKRLLTGEMNAMPRYDVVAQFVYKGELVTQHCEVVAPTRPIALVEARDQVVTRFGLDINADVRTLADCVGLEVDDA